MCYCCSPVGLRFLKPRHKTKQSHCQAGVRQTDLFSFCRPTAALHVGLCDMLLVSARILLSISNPLYSMLWLCVFVEAKERGKSDLSLKTKRVPFGLEFQAVPIWFAKFHVCMCICGLDIPKQIWPLNKALVNFAQQRWRLNKWYSDKCSCWDLFLNTFVLWHCLNEEGEWLCLLIFQNSTNKTYRDYLLCDHFFCHNETKNLFLRQIFTKFTSHQWSVCAQYNLFYFSSLLHARLVASHWLMFYTGMMRKLWCRLSSDLSSLSCVCVLLWTKVADQSKPQLTLSWTIWDHNCNWSILRD